MYRARNVRMELVAVVVDYTAASVRIAFHSDQIVLNRWFRSVSPMGQRVSGEILRLAFETLRPLGGQIIVLEFKANEVAFRAGDFQGTLCHLHVWAESGAEIHDGDIVSQFVTCGSD